MWIQLKIQEEEDLNPSTQDMVIKNNKPIEEIVEKEYKEEEEAIIKEDKTIKEYVTSLFKRIYVRRFSLYSVMMTGTKE